MAYRLPLRVEESWTGYRLVDADGRVIAAAQALPWHGVPIDRQQDFVHANFLRLAEAANREITTLADR